MLDEYQADVQYKRGKSNVAADLLSRIESPPIDDREVDIIDCTKPAEAPIDMEGGTDPPQNPLELLQHGDISVLQLQKDDEGIQKTLALLRLDDPKVSGRYLIQDDLLYHISSSTRRDKHLHLQLVIPDILIPTVIHELHTTEFSGHVGFDKTYDRARSHYYWDNMYKDIATFAQRCQICNAKQLRKHRAPLQTMPMPEYPFQIVAIDTVGPLPETSSGNKYAITLVDHFSSYPMVFPAPDKSADTVARVFLEHVIPTHSCPSVLISDNGTEFVNHTIALITKKMHINHIRTSPYHPQGNGRVERFHRWMNSMLAKFINEKQNDWDMYIPSMLMAYRTSVNESTGHTPFYLVHGRDPVLPLDTLLGPKYRYMGDDYVPTMLQGLNVAYEGTKIALQESRAKNKRIYDRRAIPPKLMMQT